MKSRQKLGLIAIGLFVISHFLPAYGEGVGFACFRVCCETLLGHDSVMWSGSWFYYSGFVISNLLFIGLTLSLFVTGRNRALRLGVSLVLFLHVLSWMVLHIVQSPSELNQIKIGYYVWLIAYAILVAAHLPKESNVSLRAIQVTPLAA